MRSSSRKKRTFALATVGALSLLLSACGGSSDNGNAGDEATGLATAGVLNVATSGNYAPFTMVNDSGELEGYAIDVANELGELLDVEIVFHTVDFVAILQGVDSGKYDISDVSPAVTEERKQEFAWSTPASSSGSVALIRSSEKDRITGLDGSLNGLNIGAIDGSAQQQWAIENSDTLGYADIKAYPGASQAIMDLQNNRIDAVVYDNLNSHFYISNNPDSGVEPVGTVQNPTLLASAVSKNNEALLAYINEGMNQLYEDGTIGELQIKWFGTTLPTPNSIDAELPWNDAPTP